MCLIVFIAREYSGGIFQRFASPHLKASRSVKNTREALKIGKHRRQMSGERPKFIQVRPKSINKSRKEQSIVLSNNRHIVCEVERRPKPERSRLN